MRTRSSTSDLRVLCLNQTRARQDANPHLLIHGFVHVRTAQDPSQSLPPIRRLKRGYSSAPGAGVTDGGRGGYRDELGGEPVPVVSRRAVRAPATGDGSVCAPCPRSTVSQVRQTAEPCGDNRRITARSQPHAETTVSKSPPESISSAANAHRGPIPSVDRNT